MKVAPDSTQPNLNRVKFNMSYEISNAIVNKVLCFVHTSRSSLSTDEIISTAVAFYSKDEIEKAKKTLFKLCAAKPIARVSCARWPNPCIAHVGDMIDLIEDQEAKDFQFPSFLADSFDALPPAGSSRMAASLNSLRDEMATF